jgi:hypothetical protein
MAFSSALCSGRLPPANTTLQRFDCRYMHLDFPLTSIATIVADTPGSADINCEFRSNRDIVGLLWTTKDKYGHAFTSYVEDRDYSDTVLAFVANPVNPFDFNVTFTSNSSGQVYRLFPYVVSGANLVPDSSDPTMNGPGPGTVFPIATVFPGGLPGLPDASYHYFVIDFDDLRLGFNYDEPAVNPVTISQLFFSLVPNEFGIGAGARIGGEGTIIGGTIGSSLEGYNTVKPVRIEYLRVLAINPDIRLAKGDSIRCVLGVPEADGGGGKTAAFKIVNRTVDFPVNEWHIEVQTYADGMGGTITGPVLFLKLPEPIEQGAWLGGGRAIATKLQKDTAIGNVTVAFRMRGVSVTGTGATIGRRLYDQLPHGMQMTSGFDDTYNITPWRQVDNTWQLGYRGYFTCYMGMSHYFKAFSSGGSATFENKVVKDAAQPLNFPTQKWCESLFAQMVAKGYKFVWSTSYEILNTYCPEEWKQRDYLQRPALSGWSPPSSFLIPAKLEAMDYLARTIKHGISLMRAAGWAEADCYFQIGEPWWWDGSYSGGAPCIYDNYTQALYVTETGNAVPTPLIQSYREPVTTTQQPYLEWLGTKLGNSTNYIRDTVKATYPTSKATLLFFSPQLFDGSQNVGGLPTLPADNTSMRNIINFPITEWEYPNYDFMQIEDYDWIIDGQLDNLPLTVEAATVLLGYPIAVVHYFVGFVLFAYQEWIWPNINIATRGAKLANIPNIYVWAYPQVIRDGILYDDTLIETNNAIQPYVPPLRQLPDQISDAYVRPIYFVQIEGATTDGYLCSADRNITYAGNTYVATGRFGRISDITESITDSSSGWTMTLSHLPLNTVEAACEAIRNGKVTLMLGLVDEANQLYADPRTVAKGKIYSNDVQIQENFGVITLSVKSALARWSNPSGDRYSDEIQQMKYPGDRGFKFVTDLASRKIKWGPQNA